MNKLLQRVAEKLCCPCRWHSLHEFVGSRRFRMLYRFARLPANTS